MNARRWAAVWLAAAAGFTTAAGQSAPTTASRPTTTQSTDLIPPPAPGVWVSYLELGGQADKAGLALLDVITAYDGQPITTADGLVAAIQGVKDDKEIPVTVWRDGKSITFTVSRGRMGVGFTPLLQRETHEFLKPLTPAQRRTKMEADAAYDRAFDRAREGDYTAAVAAAREALEKHESIRDRRAAVKDRTELAWACEYLGEYETARQLGEQALKEAAALCFDDGLASAHYVLGWYECHASRFPAAREHFQAALAIRERLGQTASLPEVLNSLGVVDLELDDPAAATATFLKALAIAEKAPNNERTLTALYDNLGTAYRRSGEYAKAIEVHHKALRLAVESENLEGQGGALASIAILWEVLGEPRQAALSWQAALTIARRMKYLGAQVTALTSLGGIFAQLNEPDAALRYYNEAEALAAKAGYHDALWQARFQRGKFYEAQRKNDLALADYQKAVEGVEAVRLGLAAAKFDAAAVRLTERRAFVYEALVLLLLKLDRRREALEFLERGKSQMLIEGLKLKSIQTGDDRLTGLLAEAAQLQERLAELQRQHLQALAQANPDQAAAERIATLIASTQADFIQVQDRIARQYGKDFNDLIKVQPTDFVDIADSIPEGVILVEYFPAPDRLILFLVGRDDFRIKEVPIGRDDLYGLVRAFRNEMRAGRAQSGIGSRLRTTILKLHQRLIAPIEPDLAAHKTVLVIPSGLLYYLPFHALAREKDGNLEFLAERPVQVVYLTRAGYLSRTLANVRQQGPARPVGVLAFGNPAGSDPPLPAAEAEAKTVAAVFPNSRAFLGPQATKARAKLFTDQATIIHFAAHARLNHDDPAQSNIALAADGNESGALTEGEIYGIKLAGSKLVVLSACETAIADDDPGKEVASLARAFTFAKAPSIVASLWQVDDPATSTLMKTFYTGLAAGLSKTEALRKAQLAVMRLDDTRRHPYFWAPFILIGAWE